MLDYIPAIIIIGLIIASIYIYLNERNKEDLFLSEYKKIIDDSKYSKVNSNYGNIYISENGWFGVPFYNFIFIKEKIDKLYLIINGNIKGLYLKGNKNAPEMLVDNISQIVNEEKAIDEVTLIFKINDFTIPRVSLSFVNSKNRKKINKVKTQLNRLQRLIDKMGLIGIDVKKLISRDDSLITIKEI